MSDDLVKRARHNALADMPHYASVELIEAMAYHIEELEAKLAKAVDDLEDMLTTPNSEAAQGILKAYVRHLIAELKGDNQ